MELRRLGWSGFEVTAQGESLVIDCVGDSSAFLSDHLSNGRPVAPLRTPASGALVTHLHFERMPNGGASVDPMPLLARACFGA